VSHFPFVIRDLLPCYSRIFVSVSLQAHFRGWLTAINYWRQRALRRQKVPFLLSPTLTLCFLLVDYSRV
jgi:hypothetical protein